MTGPGADDAAEVLAANRAFYAAVEAGDLDGIRAALVGHRDAVCVHPGAEPIHGTESVLRSWALILANTPYLQFFLTDEEVSVHGDVAAVTLTENVLAAAEGAATDTFHGGRARALNVLCRTEAGWRVWIHQASPVGSEA